MQSQKLEEGISLKFLALLRGINVGGKNIISKEELRKLFEDLGFESIRTYIQSGNILFRSNQGKTEKLKKSIEEELSKRFSYEARAVVLSNEQYKTAIESAPANWGNSEDQKHHNALFLLGNTPLKNLISELPPQKPGIETVAFGKNVIFWSVSKESLTKTSYMKLARLPVYQEVTIRNHNTVFKLLQLFDEI